MRVKDLSSHESVLKAYLKGMVEDWFLPRLHSVPRLSSGDRERYDRMCTDGGVLDQFISDVEFFIRSMSVGKFQDFVEAKDSVIFEGAQGLALSQDADGFPHVTHSYTGMRNVVEFINESLPATEHVDIFYVTRSYLTRHGAGPLKDEYGVELYADDTNLPHPFQGELRKAPLDTNAMRGRIEKDMAEAYDHMKANGTSGIEDRMNAYLVVTHVDQCDEPSPDNIAAAVGLTLAFSSNGPTADDVIEHEELDTQANDFL